MYNILVITSDKYLPCLRPMMYLLNKYWPEHPPCVIGGFKPPTFGLEAGFTFHSLGAMKDYPIQKWSDAFRKLVREHAEDVFVSLLEDMWPTRQVDARAVDILANYARQFKYVARIDLTGDRLYAHGMRDYGSVAHLDLIQSLPGSPYHLSFMAGIWRKEHFLRVIQPNWTPWDCEILGTPALSFMRDVIVLGTRQWPYRHLLALRGGESQKLLLAGMQQVDRDELTALGYLQHWGIG